MTGAHFDRFARAQLTRRSVLGALFASLLAILGNHSVQAAPCPRSKQLCRGRCIPANRCCTNASCRPKKSGKVCRRGRCVCARNKRRCGNRCIAKTACCRGCPRGHVCRQGTCCLGSIAALQAALAPGGPARIRLCPKTTYRGNLVVTRDVTITGGGPSSTILDATGTFRSAIELSEEASTIKVALVGLQVTGGRVEQGGGIRNVATLVLTNCLVTGNRATVGGGIANVGGSVTLVDTQVTTNVSGLNAGGIFNSGGPLVLRGTSRVAGNRAGTTGGGIFTIFQSSRVELHDDSIVTDNDADPLNPESGGGVFNTAPNFDGTVLFFDRSRVIGNRPNQCSGTPSCPG